ncbi:hypothetical protein WS62_05815 [Burkholderia sp. ABCPW 14]|nr:hypothetical protein WS62_05815 [Burkholderia sp. ABCPW 14]
MFDPRIAHACVRAGTRNNDARHVAPSSQNARHAAALDISRMHTTARRRAMPSRLPGVRFAIRARCMSSQTIAIGTIRANENNF